MIFVISGIMMITVTICIIRFKEGNKTPTKILGLSVFFLTVFMIVFIIESKVIRAIRDEMYDLQQQYENAQSKDYVERR